MTTGTVRAACGCDGSERVKTWSSTVAWMRIIVITITDECSVGKSVTPMLSTILRVGATGSAKRSQQIIPWFDRTLFSQV